MLVYTALPPTKESTSKSTTGYLTTAREMKLGQSIWPESMTLNIVSLYDNLRCRCPEGKKGKRNNSVARNKRNIAIVLDMWTAWRTADPCDESAHKPP